MMTKSRWIGAAVLPVLLAHGDDEPPCRRTGADADDDEAPVAFESAEAFARHLGALLRRGDGFGGSRAAAEDPGPVSC